MGVRTSGTQRRCGHQFPHDAAQRCGALLDRLHAFLSVFVAARVATHEVAEAGEGTPGHVHSESIGPRAAAMHRGGDRHRAVEEGSARARTPPLTAAIYSHPSTRCCGPCLPQLAMRAVRTVCPKPYSGVHLPGRTVLGGTAVTRNVPGTVLLP